MIPGPSKRDLQEEIKRLRAENEKLKKDQNHLLEDAAYLAGLEEDGKSLFPLLREECPGIDCSEDPALLTGQPIGQYHCPLCGMMVVAGFPHPPHDNGIILDICQGLGYVPVVDLDTLIRAVSPIEGCVGFDISPLKTQEAFLGTCTIYRHNVPAPYDYTYQGKTPTEAIYHSTVKAMKALREKDETN